MNIHCRLFTLSKGCRCIIPNTFSVSYFRNGPFRLQCNYVSTGSNFRARSENGFLKSALLKIPFLKIADNKLKATGYFLYESTVDKLPYAEFFKRFSLPNSFNSWFIVTELHVWMLVVRSMAEGKDGIKLRTGIIEALWADVDMRIKQLGFISQTEKRNRIDELSQQFNAALVGYDEGIQSNDKVLANALWRRFFQRNCENMEVLEPLVEYTRKQISLLDELTSDQLVTERQVKWITLKNK